jgi:hypothetical protein
VEKILLALGRESKQVTHNTMRPTTKPFCAFVLGIYDFPSTTTTAPHWPFSVLFMGTRAMKPKLKGGARCLISLSGSSQISAQMK